jgi:hypothetical protein
MNYFKKGKKKENGQYVKHTHIIMYIIESSNIYDMFHYFNSTSSNK